MTQNFMTLNTLVYHWCCKDSSNFKGNPSEKTYDSHAARWRIYRFATCPFLKQLALTTADRFRVIVITAQQQAQTWGQVIPFLLKLEELWTKYWRIVVNVGRIVRRYAQDTLRMPCTKHVAMACMAEAVAQLFDTDHYGKDMDTLLQYLKPYEPMANIKFKVLLLLGTLACRSIRTFAAVEPSNEVPALPPLNSFTIHPQAFNCVAVHLETEAASKKRRREF